MSQHAQIVYFYGVPGSAHELDLFGSRVASDVANFHIPRRGHVQNSISSHEYFGQLADEIKRQFPAKPLHLIGFSMGACAALRSAYYLGDQIKHIDLVSAAAPLNLGCYLQSMAGAPVFRIAGYSSRLFRLMAGAQSFVAKVAPGRMYAMLFASALAADRELIADPIFRQNMMLIIRQCLGKELATYCREIELYVNEWREGLDQITQPVSLYHGLSDNWSPVAMAEDLARKLPNVISVNLLNGMSHYSTLREYLKGR